MSHHIRLGINIDHVATLRNARGGIHPDPVRAALIAESAGADGITAHLREDRRHIRDADIYNLKKEISVPLNMEMATTDEMQNIALDVKPNACCLVPEKREELTTEGGLDVVSSVDRLAAYITPLKKAGIRVSLFIDPDEAQIRASREIGADIVELHTGTYCHAFDDHNTSQAGEELFRLVTGAELAESVGLEVHAGHGLNYASVGPVAEIPQIRELNIGHFLMGESLFTGLETAIKTMRTEIDASKAAS